MYSLQNTIKFSNLTKQKITNKHKLKIRYIDNDYNNLEKVFSKHDVIELKVVKKITNAVFGYDNTWKNVSSFITNALTELSPEEIENNITLQSMENKDKDIISDNSIINYNFKVPKRKDNQIRLIYCGSLSIDTNILEIIEHFKRIHTEYPEIVLTIVYESIKSDDDFIYTMNDVILNGISGITFKHIVSDKDTCFEIVQSDIGICSYKSQIEVNTKKELYGLYGLHIIDNLSVLSVCYLSNIINKTQITSDILIINDNYSYNYLYFELFSKSSSISELIFNVNNKALEESNCLLSNQYVTPNYIDKSIHENVRFIYISGKMISKIVISKCNNVSLICNYNLINRTVDKYKNDKNFNNQIAFIGDEFTYNSLNDVINVHYISKDDANTIDVNKYDFLFCESTWHGKDGSWKYAFNLYKKKIYSQKLIQIVKLFKKNKKSCIYYNKEDPTHYNQFHQVGELFDIIITTSKNCLDKYKKVYPNKIIFSKPFLCNPIIHNPINNLKENTAYFIGGFYNHLKDRTKNTNMVFDNVISKNIDFKIINRHYFYKKITRQIKTYDKYKDRYELDSRFSKYNNPSVKHQEAIQTYKKSLFHININTVTECETMTSRRLIELLACGCNIYSNYSKSIDKLKLPVLTTLNDFDNSIFKTYNLDGFYLTHQKFSYITFIEDIYSRLNLILKNTSRIKIVCSDKNNIPNSFHKYFVNDDYDYELILNDNKYYHKDFIQKLIIYTNFYYGNINFTDDKNKYFTISNDFDIQKSIVKTTSSLHTLFIPYIKNKLYDNLFDYKVYYDTIHITKEINNDSVLVVMCVWKRLDYLNKTLRYIENQSIHTKITLCIWNNNYEKRDYVNTIIDKFKSKNIEIIIHHSSENIGGIGRFIFTKYICEKKYQFENVIFIDDDQIIKDDFIENIILHKKPNSGLHWYGKKFYKDSLYMDSWSNLRYKERPDFDYSNFDKTILDYGGTGGMIIDTECFLTEEFYKFNKDFQFIEDLWMSYFVITRLNYKLYNGYDILSKSINTERTISNDNNAQWLLLKSQKNDFLKVLREYGEWDV